jgi:hypothetical protein
VLISCSLSLMSEWGRRLPITSFVVRLIPSGTSILLIKRIQNTLTCSLRCHKRSGFSSEVCIVTAATAPSITNVDTTSGGHDNGYQGSLVALHTLGFKEKLVLLQSYTQTAREIGTLRLPTLEIPGLFMTSKLDKRPVFKKTRVQSEPVFSHSSPANLPPRSASPQKKGSNGQSKWSKKKNKAAVAPAAGGGGLPGVNISLTIDNP